MKVKLSVFAGAVLAPLFLVPACGEDAPLEPKPQVVEKKVTLVKTQIIEPSLFVQKLTLSADAKASKEVFVASEISGKVVQISFKKGERVTKGTTLVQLDTSSIRADISAAIADKDLTALNYRKLRSLEKKKAAVSEIQVEQAKLRLDAAKARVKSLETMLQKHTIKAPFSGVLASRDTELGAIVRPGARLTKIVALKPIKVATGIPETAITDFAIGKEAKIIFDAYPGTIYTGKVTYIAPEVNPVTRVFESEVLLSNSKLKIRPAMSAKVTFIKRKIENSIVVPQTAVLELAEGHAVFLVTKDNVAKIRKIEIKDHANEMALIASGLSGGETLVISGQRGLVDGDTVKVFPSSK